MSDNVSGCYTVGQVAELTNIERRKIKYFVERSLIKPKKKKIEGAKESWLYSDTDIIKIRQIKLFLELGYPEDEIKKIVNSPEYDWRSTLDQQITDLKGKKRHIENQIFVAELMRNYAESTGDSITPDISDFDNNIDQFAVSTWGSMNEDEVTAKSFEKVNADIAEGLNVTEIYKQGQEIIELLQDVSKSMQAEPDSTEVQNKIGALFDYISTLSEGYTIDPSDILFGIRLVSNISMDRIIDLFFSKVGSTDFILKALQVYCNYKKEVKDNG